MFYHYPLSLHRVAPSNDHFFQFSLYCFMEKINLLEIFKIYLEYFNIRYINCSIKNKQLYYHQVMNL